MVADENCNIVYLTGVLTNICTVAEADIRKALPNFDARAMPLAG